MLAITPQVAAHKRIMFNNTIQNVTTLSYSELYLNVALCTRPNHQHLMQPLTTVSLRNVSTINKNEHFINNSPHSIAAIEQVDQVQCCLTPLTI